MHLERGGHGEHCFKACTHLPGSWQHAMLRYGQQCKWSTLCSSDLSNIVCARDFVVDPARDMHLERGGHGEHCFKACTHMPAHGNMLCCVMACSANGEKYVTNSEVL